MARYVFSSSLLLAALSMGVNAMAQDPVTIPASTLASGTQNWVHSSPDYPNIDAQVDVGTMHQVDDAIEVAMRWPLRYGTLDDMRAQHPNMAIPDGSFSLERERVVCRPDFLIFYDISEGILAPDGTIIHLLDKDPGHERAEAEFSAQQLATNYGSDPRSLVCWAAAHTCAHTDMTWPPPPNNTPLEHSERATGMNKKYNAQFIPGCKL